MTRTRTTLFILSLAIAGALVGCTNNNDQALDDTTTTATAPGDDAMPPAYDDSAAMGANADATADAGFYQQAMQGNRKEIATGELAQQQAQDESVKDYARMMVTDHTAMERQLAEAAGMADAAAPAPDPSATVDLEGKTGADFDRAYIDMMVADHEKTVALFEDAAQNAATEEARSLAANALPKLREHLERARELQQR